MVVTALPVEYRAVVAHLSELQEVVHQGSVYEHGAFHTAKDTWDVWIAQAGAGNGRAAQETERIVNHAKPSVALFVGVAGGLKDVKLGDVVAGTMLYGYESGKAGELFLTRPDVGEGGYHLVQRAMAAARKQEWVKRVVPSAAAQPVEPEAFVGPMASGEKVVVSDQAQVFLLVRSHYNDALALEMEGRGFLLAAHASGVEALVVRGISDLIANKADSDAAGWQAIASRHAAAFAFEVLARYGDARETSEQESAVDAVKTVASRATLFKQVNRLLAENGKLYKQYGPLSPVAVQNPLSRSADVWRTVKRDTIIPNNRRIMEILDAGSPLLTDAETDVFLDFKMHAIAFELSSEDRLDGDAVPLFPQEFRLMVEREVQPHGTER